MMQDRVKQYLYQRLPTAASIRLIRVLPGRVDGSIVCSLQTINSAHHTGVEYQALSYLWGDPKTTRKIYVRDEHDSVLHEHHLHENLWQFLEKWQQPRTQPSGLLWTDSLCLNQEDSEEKAQQIRRMGEIYSGAKEVIIWLGPDTTSMAWTRDMLGKGAQDAATRILELPYWRRAWIVQEVALAQRALVTCGNISIELSEFKYQIPLPLSGDMRVISYLLGLHLEKRRPLWWILERLVLKTESTRAVDKVFGFLGLVRPNENGSSPTDYIKVDYGRRPVDVLFDAIFEACPPFGSTQRILQNLETSFGRAKGAYGIRADAQALAGYLREREISERHVHFASLALRVHEAARVAVTRLAISSETWSEIRQNIGFNFSRKFKWQPEWQPRPSRNALFVGFNLTLDCESLHEDGQTQSVQGQASPWLCSAHARDVREPGPLLNTLEVVTAFVLDTKNLPRLCARHSLEAGCDVSRVDFYMPDMAFRMTVAPFEGADGRSAVFAVTNRRPPKQE